MEITLAILMALGIFVGIPLLIGLFIAGLYVKSDRKLLRKQRSSLESAVEASPVVDSQEMTEPAAVQEEPVQA